MKTIIAGSRTITDYALVEAAVRESGFEITEVVSGTCDGVDKLGERWAKLHSVPVKPFEPDWNRFKKHAGPIRNSEMACYAEALVAIRAPGKSNGTDDMIHKATVAGLRVFVKRL